MMLQMLYCSVDRPRVGPLLVAVYALAKGLHKTLECTTTTCPKAGNEVSYRRVYENMLNTEFRVPDLPSESFRLDTNGDLAEVSYDYHFINPQLKKNKRRTFGRWTLKGGVSSIHVDESKIMW